MFDRYTLSGCFADAEAMVSVAKMKNHAFMGVTLCTKNLFGLPPMTLQAGRVRTYYHHVIRLSYVLADLGLILQPCLNIVDALTGQSGREWDGEGRVCNALLAGEIDIDFFGEIPIDTRIRFGGDSGVPIVASAPDSEHAGRFLDIASKVALKIADRILSQPKRSPRLSVIR